MKKVLFVCLGNICRSPSAEGVMQKLVDEGGLSKSFELDSAGTIGHHAGETADSRMREHALKRGYDLKSISRKIIPSDFEKFDLILAMDDRNFADLTDMDNDGQYAHKIQKITDFCRHFKAENVPDPYYGGNEGFETVLDILEDACQGLLEDLT
jgi:protein-tyrosine phosphatase